MLKALLTVTFMAFTVFGASQAQARLCYLGDGSNPLRAEVSPEVAESFRDMEGGPATRYFDTSNPHNFDGLQCKTLKPFQIGLEVIGIGLQGVGVYATCTGAGAPVGVILGVAGLATTVVSFGVSHLPCEEDTVSKDDVKKLIRDEICAELEGRGTPCSRDAIVQD